MRFALQLLFATTLAAQTSQVPYEQYGGPLYSITSVKYSQPSQARSIHEVDFRNMLVSLRDVAVQLKDGKYEHRAPGDTLSVNVDAVYYLDGSHALVIYNTFEAGGSSNSSGMAMLYEHTSGALKTVQVMDWDTHSGSTQPNYLVDEKQKVLIVRSSHYMPGDAHCCISAIDVVTFAWKKDRFQQTSVTTELSVYGREKNKKLPQP